MYCGPPSGSRRYNGCYCRYNTCQDEYKIHMEVLAGLPLLPLSILFK